MIRRYLASPREPLRDVLRAATGKAPPRFVRGYSTRGLTDEQNDRLQDWAATHARPGWLTGIGLIEAAEAQVAEAVANGNIPPEGEGPVTAAPPPRTVLPGHLSDDEKTVPESPCDGDPGCEGRPAFLALGTGERLCAHCAADRAASMVAEPAERDTERPEAPGGGP